MRLAELGMDCTVLGIVHPESASESKEDFKTSLHESLKGVRTRRWAGRLAEERRQGVPS